MGAKMVEFNGWDMPVEYPASIGCGIVAEHMAVRTGVVFLTSATWATFAWRARGAGRRPAYFDE